MFIEKIVTTVFEPAWCKVDFSEYGQAWRDIRPDKSPLACFRCDREFEDGDTVGLVGMHRKICNQTACRDCAEAIRDQLHYEQKYPSQ